MDLKTQLTEFEGRRNKAYLDTENVWTIGIGHTGPEVHEGLVWTDEQIDQAFEQDVREAWQDAWAVAPWLGRLNDPRQAVIVGMCFQMGQAKVAKFQRTLAAIRDERFYDAETFMLDSLWAKQTPRRAKRLARQMVTGEWQ